VVFGPQRRRRSRSKSWDHVRATWEVLSSLELERTPNFAGRGSFGVANPKALASAPSVSEPATPRHQDEPPPPLESDEDEATAVAGGAGEAPVAEADCSGSRVQGVAIKPPEMPRQVCRAFA
jgi:hypothetical protein